MAVPDQFGIYVETVKSLNGHLTVRKYIDIPTCCGRN